MTANLHIIDNAETLSRVSVGVTLLIRYRSFPYWKCHMSLQDIITLIALTLIAVSIGVIYPILKWRDWRGAKIHIIIIFLWYGLWYFWGPWKWRPAEFRSPEWMWDNYGHIAGGFLGTIHCIYDLRYFFPILFLTRGRPGTIIRRLTLYAAVPVVIFAFAFGWEFWEMLRDWLETGVRAQMGNPDTIIDIALALISCGIVLLVQKPLLSLIDKLTLIETNELNQLKELEMRAETLRSERNDLIRDIRELKRAQFKELTPAWLKRFKEKIHPSSDEEDI